MAIVTESNDGKKAMADEELPGDAEEPSKEPQPPPGEPISYRAPQPKPKTAGGGFFTIYKKGQGYWTRMGTAIGAGFLGAMVAYEIYDKLPTFLPSDPTNSGRDKHIALVVALVFLTAYTGWAYWYTNKPTTVDFLVATDSEMKKVNWTTRKELIGSTKIVILFMLMIALYLFACDLVFGGFFHLIHVVKTWF